MSDLKTINVTPAKIKQFKSKNINTIQDLINFFPYKYIDCTKDTDILDDDISCIVVRTFSIKKDDLKRYISIQATKVQTGEKINIMWFNQNFLYDNLQKYIGINCFVCGKFVYNSSFKNYTVTSPIVFGEDNNQNRKIIPVYSKIAGMSNDYLESKIKTALGIGEYVTEHLPEQVVDDYNLISHQKMIFELHNPTNLDMLKKAKYRQKFEKLLHFAIKLKLQERSSPKGNSFCIKTTSKYNQFICDLPFELTKDQKSVLNDFLRSAQDFRRINSLVCGDVGCGKTVIIQALAVLYAENGYQSAIMCPSVALASQHYEETSRLLSKYGINVCLYKGTSMKAAEKRDMLEKIKNGYYQVVIGTHAIISKDIEFNKLAMVMIDEEQKFGVLQEQALIDKANNEGVNVAKFSATPIPLTLFKALNAININIKIIKTKPEGRILPKCGITNKQDEIFRVITREIDAGHQAYVISPTIEPSEKICGESVKEISKVFTEHYKNRPDIKIATITGNDKRAVIEDTLRKFQNNEIQILVSSTIIETGINNKNANCLALYGGRLLGLSTIHQIRGRILRGGLTPYFMMYSQNIYDERLNFIAKTTDGFSIAEYDLKTRSQGNITDGYTQHGNDECVDLMLANKDIFAKAKEAALYILDNCDISSIII